MKQRVVVSYQILSVRKKKNSGNGVTISAKKISSYFPSAYTKQEIENVIYTLLEQWKNGREEELEHGEDTI